MSEMIKAAEGFQYSVNISYDLYNDTKLKNFIPTKMALDLIESVLQSTNPNATNRARILIGAYGKGKSHIVLAILAMLMQRPIELFKNAEPKINSREHLKQVVENFYKSKRKFLPVIISGTYTSLTQAFLLALQQTLAQNDFLDILPDTNYLSAVKTIKKWETEYPATFEDFKGQIGISVEQFISELEDFNIDVYKQFEDIYPKLTSGSVFNPFLGFDVVELYESVAKAIKAKGYSGLYVVYDEFSKYLESNIKTATVSDTKMLQDFAERCARNDDAVQLHIMLISHKEIANYIDKLPKEKVDGWRGISGRFEHIHLNNNFTQTYEIIASTIEKEPAKWQKFLDFWQEDFTSIKETFKNHEIFSDLDETSVGKIIESCYPLHPVSTYILPRLSERIAQNERTLFTFLAADTTATLPSFLKNYDDKRFELITPDLMYDYFEPLFRKEIDSGSLHDTYILTSRILEKIHANILECKIVKTISLIYILEQFEKLKPTVSELVRIYSASYSADEIKNAIDDLVHREFVVYLRKSNSYLKLKESSGIDILQAINDEVEKENKKITLKEILNASNPDKYMYPSRYNDEKEMTRFFAFEFISEDEITDDVNWNLKHESVSADGIIYGVMPKSNETIEKVYDQILETSTAQRDILFIIPKQIDEDKEIDLRRFNAVSELKRNAADDLILKDEYEVVYDDLKEVVNEFVSSYTHPERMQSCYIYNGEKLNFSRKSQLAEQLSKISNSLYPNTPVINNEVINKNEITGQAFNSRNKIISALLRNDLEHNLGLLANGQDVSIMRSTLVRTGILHDIANENVEIRLQTNNNLLNRMLSVIEDFIKESVQASSNHSFKDLYNALQGSGQGIGLRKGLIPIYIAAVFHNYKKQIVIKQNNLQQPLSLDTILQIDENPEDFTLSAIDWNSDKENYVRALEEVFADFVVDAEKNINTYEYVAKAMVRWYLSLPKYTKEIKRLYNDSAIPKENAEFLKSLRQNIGSQELLFEKLPAIFCKAVDNTELLSDIVQAKGFFEDIITNLNLYLQDEVKEILSNSDNRELLLKTSLTSVIQTWTDSLPLQIFEHLFSDGTNKFLVLCKNITNNTQEFIEKLAKLATGLRLEDWDDKTVSEFLTNITTYKNTAESFIPEEKQNSTTNEADSSSSYQLQFLDDDGKPVVRRFDKVEVGVRGKLLYNRITDAIDAMGLAVSEQEKRQVLMNILKELC
ncbi:MAG: hypothetical protein IJ558_10140 [Treponema sp.]|nr:hypothetical protein [Treponema sp.]